MPTRPRVLEFDVTVDRAGDARSALGGSALPFQPEWWSEHLVLAGLVRCSLASMEHTARRAGLDSNGAGSAHAVVARRDDDGLYAFVDIQATLEVDLAPAPQAGALAELVARAERGCFVSNSLSSKPTHRWIVNGQEVS
jgi:organic hydroperoxide reductase OsmC/OhrA